MEPGVHLKLSKQISNESLCSFLASISQICTELDQAFKSESNTIY